MPASLYTSLKTDYKVLDGTESVTFTSVGAAGDTSVTVAHADGNEITARDAAESGGFFQVGDTAWDLWTNELSALVPKPNDYLATSAGVKWYVLTATLDDLGLAYRCVCRKGRGQG